MGMSIEERITQLVRVKHYASPRHYETLDVAIDTMHKYQKIKEQVDIAIDKENFAISDARLIQIREIMNGNDD